MFEPPRHQFDTAIEVEVPLAPVVTGIAPLAMATLATVSLAIWVSLAHLVGVI